MNLIPNFKIHVFGLSDWYSLCMSFFVQKGHTCSVVKANAGAMTCQMWLWLQVIQDLMIHRHWSDYTALKGGAAKEVP